jgi:hypothetical protein
MPKKAPLIQVRLMIIINQADKGSIRSNTFPKIRVLISKSDSPFPAKTLKAVMDVVIAISKTKIKLALALNLEDNKGIKIIPAVVNKSDKINIRWFGIDDLPVFDFLIRSQQNLFHQQEI